MNAEELPQPPDAAPVAGPEPDFATLGGSAPPPPERDPFWGYSDLLMFAGLAVPCMLLGLGLVKAVILLFHWHSALRSVELIPAQFTGYALLFLALRVMLRVQYDRPFWLSLGWKPTRLSIPALTLLGVASSVTVVVVGTLIRTPTTDNPFLELLKDRTSIILVAIFGMTVGPLSEELIFRGFLQPLLIRSLGIPLGILGAALPFGILHFWEYGNSWRHVFLIALAGVAFGVVRQVTGSTKASTIMHAAYNGLFFVALLAARPPAA